MRAEDRGSGAQEWSASWGPAATEVRDGQALGSGDQYARDHFDFQQANVQGDAIAKMDITHNYPYGAAAPTALASLPARTVGFTGREAGMRQLLAALDPSGVKRDSPQIVVVSGLGGIGKTSFAVQGAHEACDRGWFPGGTLHIDLQGYAEAPVTAAQALQQFLRALGIAPEHIPGTADARAALYRSHLADKGPVLILADNASSSRQIALLVPRDARHCVLATSRDKLPQPGARQMPLDELTPKDACDLLAKALRDNDDADTRITDDPEGTRDLAVACGHLPLALQIVAWMLICDGGTPAELAAELAVEYFDDGERSVWATFDLSYRRLPQDQARLLRLLAQAPGPETGNEAIAALLDVAVPPLGALTALRRAHLVERRDDARARWRMHGLLRDYADKVGAGDPVLEAESTAARKRVLAFYAERTAMADAWLRALPGAPVPGLFADRAAALAWLDVERPNLVAAAQQTKDDRHTPVAIGLALNLFEYLEWRHYFDDLAIVSCAAREAAHRIGDARGEGRAWNNLGAAQRQAGQASEAIKAHITARDIFQAIGDAPNEGIAWNNLGAAQRHARQGGAAIEAHTRARDIFQGLGDARNEGIACNYLGGALRFTGQVDEAIDAYHNALAICQAVGDRRSEGMAWNYLGATLRQKGHVDEAIEAYGNALDICRTLDDRRSEGMAWNYLGIVRREAGEEAKAVDAHIRALDLFRTVGDRRSEGMAWENLALVHKAADRPSEAQAAWVQAAEAYARAGDDKKAGRARDHLHR
ncbi:tetratricopeptide repeat protein [Streptomyces sp. NPDC096310]|uniref:tetratricopeptide repeat protein n=1 Tax=Streptomyces sp. NPDC096310 TaxID=3366082 RepID=UPI0037FC1C17